MYIEKIEIKNFRLLKDITMSLEPGLSLVIGKNNVGKTSLLKVLKRFLEEGDNPKFQFNDFNIDFQEELKNDLDPSTPEKSLEEYTPLGISMKILIKIDPKDNLGIVSKIALTLEPDNYYVALGFDYTLPYDAYRRFRNAIITFLDKENTKKKSKRKNKDIHWFLEKNHSDYFQLIRKSIYSNKEGELNEDKYILLKNIPDFQLKHLISFKVIEAKRDVENKDNDKTLSVQIAKLYNQIEKAGNKNEKVEQFEDELITMDKKLSRVYKTVFKDIRKIVKQFGGYQPAEMEIKVDSSLASRDLMKWNTVVKYNHSGKDLPENFNGLGYMNLLSMLFEIERIRNEFSNPPGENVAEINLLFIEEPEAHTHPQMQNIFIRNIKNLLAKGVEKKLKDIPIPIRRDIQYIISSHSPHIVSNCDFNDLKYIRLDGKYASVKNFKELKEMYRDDQTAFAFVKQYLTIHRCELFFADKAVIIEGDTERILLPAMMQKIDSDGDKSGFPLLSQNISIIECGAYSHKFIPLLNFLQLKKTCIITDIDFCLKELNEEGKEKGHAKKGKWDESQKDRYITSNSALNKYFPDKNVIDLINMTENAKIGNIESEDSQLACSAEGNYRICFQIEENGYKARSFEDAFFNVNKHLLKEKVDKRHWEGFDEEILNKFRSDDPEYKDDVYKLAEEGIKSKARLASDFLYQIYGGSSSEGKKIVWNVPKYIKEGLEWLKKN